MAYIKTDWQTGDVITAPRMNKIEQGIADLNDAVAEVNTDTEGITNVIDAIRNEPLTQGALLQTGRVYQTLCIDDFKPYKDKCYIDSSEHTSGYDAWYAYKFEFEHRTMFRVDAINLNAQVSGVVPIVAKLGSSYYPIQIDPQVISQTYFVADVLFMNYFKPYESPAADSFSLTMTARREFEDAIVCLDHVNEFDSIVVFGDSIAANYLSTLTTGVQNPYQDHTNGVMAQFATQMGLPVYNHAEQGATLSTLMTDPINTVRQILNYKNAPDGGSKPLFIIAAGTNDQSNYHLSNIGEYGTDTTSTIYGAIKTAINTLLARPILAEPWQILVITPIPKGIRAANQGNGATYIAGLDIELTTIAEAMYEVGIVQGCNVINGFHTIFENLQAWYARVIMMPDDTHPSAEGAKYYAQYLYDALCAKRASITVSGTTMIVS